MKFERVTHFKSPGFRGNPEILTAVADVSNILEVNPSTDFMAAYKLTLKDTDYQTEGSNNTILMICYAESNILISYNRNGFAPLFYTQTTFNPKLTELPGNTENWLSKPPIEELQVLVDALVKDVEEYCKTSLTPDIAEYIKSKNSDENQGTIQIEIPDSKADTESLDSQGSPGSPETLPE